MSFLRPRRRQAEFLLEKDNGVRTARRALMKSCCWEGKNVRAKAFITAFTSELEWSRWKASMILLTGAKVQSLE